MENSEIQHPSHPPNAGNNAGNALVSPKTIEPLLRPSDESEHVHGQREPGSIGAQCLTFLQSVNSTFGEHSREWTTIHQALNEFKAGRLSKRDAHQTMVKILGDNQELKQGLVDVLQHKDALWSPGDFYHPSIVQPGSASAAQISPDFLQPQHQPQLRVPSISAPWTPSQYVLPQQPTAQSINPALLRSHVSQHGLDRDAPLLQHPDVRDMLNIGYGGYGGCSDYEGHGANGSYHSTFAQNPYPNWNPFFTPNGPSSPGPPLPSEVPLLHHYASPSVGQAPNFPSYNGQGYDMGFSSPARDCVEPNHRSYPLNEGWDRGSIGADRRGADHHYPQERPHAVGANQPARSPVIMNKVSTPQLASPHLSSPNAAPSMLGTPIAVPLGQPTFEMPPPKNRNRNSSVASKNPDLHQENGVESGFLRQSPPLPPPKEQVISRQPEEAQSDSKPRKQRASRDSGQFVHAICGKAFHSRSSVKKHHWGAKNEDITTKTGCWAKNGRPNREWDEHPSCKQELPKSRTAKPAHSSVKVEDPQTTISSEYRAPVTPTMVPNPENIIPGFPTLQELPKTVAEVVHATPTFAGEPIQYHASRLPSRGSLDSLLTVVNVASQIDAPKPQGRNDSLVSNLDAQVAAAERSRQDLFHGSNGHESGYSSLEYQLHAQDEKPIIDPGITEAEGSHVPMNMILPSQRQIELVNARGLMKSSKVEPTADTIRVASADEGQMSSITPVEEKDGSGKSRRVPGRRTGISKRERKMLGLAVSPSPGPEKKKQKV